MWDWNNRDVKTERLEVIIAKMQECSQHVFQILSKRPDGYARFEYPRNVWLGTSINRTEEIGRIHRLPNNGNIRFVSIEPIHEKIDYWFTNEVDWIIVGAETGRRKDKILPQPEWIEAIIKNVTAEEIPLFIKDNVKWPNVWRQFPIQI